MDTPNNVSGNNNAENNSSISTDETNLPESTRSSWLTKSVINKSLYSEDDLSKIITPKIIVNQEQYSKVRRIILSIHRLFSKEEFTYDDLNNFNKFLKRFVWLSDGNSIDDKGVEIPGGVSDGKCAFDDFPIHSSTSCKRPFLSENAERFVDIYNNTLVLFYKKVKSKNPELLIPSTWSNISETFTNCIKGIYYFSGLKYSGKRLCEKMTPLVDNINKIFKSVEGGRPILIETGTKGRYSCGRGIIWAPYKTKADEMREGVFIHQTIGEEDDSVNTKILTNIPTIGGSRRLRRNRKRKTIKTIKRY